MTADVQNAVRELARAFYQVSGGVDVPIHVTRRLAFLIGDEEPVFIDVSLSEPTSGQIEGQVVVFTSTLLLTADLEDVPDTRRRDEEGGRVAIAVVSRKTLTAIRVASGDDGSNSTSAWLPDEWGGGDTWPRGGQLSLSYEHLEDAVTIPRARPQYQGDVVALLAGLTADLAA